MSEELIKDTKLDDNNLVRGLLERMGINTDCVLDRKGPVIEVSLLDKDINLEEGFKKLTGGDCNEGLVRSNDL